MSCIEVFPPVVTMYTAVYSTKGLSSREAARGHATNVDGEMLSVTINRIYNY